MTGPVDVAIVCAMTSEFEAVKAALEGADEMTLSGGRRAVAGTCGDARVAAICSGIGKANAASAAEAAIAAWQPKTLVTCGLCGGLRETMNVFDVYAVKEAVEYDFDLSEVDHCPVGKLEEFPSRYLPFVVPGDGAWGGDAACRPRLRAETLATGDHFRNGDGDYALIVGDIGAGLRDMEGAAVAHVALRHGLRVAGLKCVTNVRGKGAMTGQYEANRDEALGRLTAALPAFLAAL